MLNPFHFGSLTFSIILNATEDQSDTDETPVTGGADMALTRG